MTREEKVIEMCQGILNLIKDDKIDPAQAYGAEIFIKMAMSPNIGDDEFDLIYQWYSNSKESA